MVWNPVERLYCNNGTVLISHCAGTMHGDTVEEVFTCDDDRHGHRVLVR